MKKYKVIMDLFVIKDGEKINLKGKNIIEKKPPNGYESDDYKHICYGKSFVENNPAIFQEIKGNEYSVSYEPVKLRNDEWISGADIFTVRTANVHTKEEIEQRLNIGITKEELQNILDEYRMFYGFYPWKSKDKEFFDIYFKGGD